MEIKSVLLTGEEAARLRDMNERMAGLQRSVTMFQEVSERRATEIQSAMNKEFSALAEKYGLDLSHVMYVLSQDGKSLVPAQARFDQ